MKKLSAELSKKIEGGPSFRTEISSLMNGQEKRNIALAYPKLSYEISLKDLSQLEFNQVQNLFYQSYGRAKAFLIKDWNDFSATSVKIGEGNDLKTEFNLIKIYGDIENDADDDLFKRRIYYPITSSVKIYLDGTLEGEENYQISSSGTIIFDTAPADGVVITADFEFDVKVRFANDSFSVKPVTNLKSSADKISLVEVI